jgi:hypothetical protein
MPEVTRSGYHRKPRLKCWVVGDVVDLAGEGQDRLIGCNPKISLYCGDPCRVDVRKEGELKRAFATTPKLPNPIPGDENPIAELVEVHCLDWFQD